LVASGMHTVVPSPQPLSQDGRAAEMELLHMASPCSCLA
jgi:hypothetical protein